MDEQASAVAEQPRCVRIRITMRNTEVFEQVHRLDPDVSDPQTWGPAHEEAYGRTFDEMVRQGHLHNPAVKPAFEIVDCPEELRGVKVHSAW